MIITQTPFRMSFFGGGTDFPDFYKEHGGAVISTTFDKYCYVNVRHLPRFFDYSTELSYSKIERVTDVNDINHPAIREAMKYLDMQGYIDAEVDGQDVRFLKEFLEELKANSMIDIYDETLPDNAELFFVHGEKDPVVPVHTTKAFAEKHGYPIVIIPDEGHSISDSADSPAKVADAAYEFFCKG